MKKSERLNEIIARVEELKKYINKIDAIETDIEKELSGLESNINLSNINLSKYRNAEIDRLLRFSDKYEPQHNWSLKSLITMLGMDKSMSPVMNKILRSNQSAFIDGDISEEGVYELILSIHTKQTVVIKREIARLLAAGNKNQQKFKANGLI